MQVLVDICWLESRGFGPADGREVIAAGLWSEPVADACGRAVRGRLVICEKPRSDELRETPVYVELQDGSQAHGNSTQGGSRRLFCDMGKHDLRSKSKGGLQCEMHDHDGRPIHSTPFAFGGDVPKSEWITLPSDATIRLRASPFGIRREKALAICPHPGKLWVIGDNDPRAYFLSGSFTVDPADAPVEPGGDPIWRGTIVLPAVRIVNRQH